MLILRLFMSKVNQRFVGAWTRYVYLPLLPYCKLTNYRTIHSRNTIRFNSMST